jgi:hypothetical protein
VIPADTPARHSAQQSSPSALATPGGAARRFLPPPQPHRARLTIENTDQRGRLPPPLQHEGLKFSPSLRMSANDVDRGVEGIAVGDVWVDHSKVAQGSRRVRRGFCRGAISDSPGILFSHFLQRRKVSQGSLAGAVVGGRGLDFSLIPPGPVEARTTRMVVSAAVFGILYFIILSD